MPKTSIELRWKKYWHSECNKRKSSQQSKKKGSTRESAGGHQSQYSILNALMTKCKKAGTNAADTKRQEKITRNTKTAMRMEEPTLEWKRRSSKPHLPLQQRRKRVRHVKASTQSYVSYAHKEATARPSPPAK